MYQANRKEPISQQDNPRGRSILSSVRRIAVTITGSLLLIVGVALLPLPGPGLLVILAGLGILSLEYGWARRLIRRLPGKWRKR